MPDAKTVGARLRKLREERNMTLKELSERTGITTISLADYEAGQRKPNDEKKFILAQCLGASVDSIFFDD